MGCIAEQNGYGNMCLKSDVQAFKMSRQNVSISFYIDRRKRLSVLFNINKVEHTKQYNETFFNYV